jgi:hypothetical protein
MRGGIFVEKAIRSFPGGVRAAERNAIEGGAGRSRSTGAEPEPMSWKRAVSITVRLRMPLTDSPCQLSALGAIETRPRWGFRPNSPHHAEGMRIEPAPSEPSAAPIKPAATAAPLPPLEPPGAR